MDEADAAQAHIEAEAAINERIRRSLPQQGTSGFHSLFCLDCDSQLPQQRYNNHCLRCTECQTDYEKITALRRKLGLPLEGHSND